MINDREIDFIAQKNGLIEYYQVTYLMETEKTREREFGALLLVGDQYPKYVLSMDNIDFSQQGIVHKNIINFLLEWGNLYLAIWFQNKLKFDCFSNKVSNSQNVDGRYLIMIKYRYLDWFY